MAPRTLRPWHLRSTPGLARRLLGERPQRRLTSSFYQPTQNVLRRPLESTLAASVAVMHEPAAMEGPPVMQSLLQRIEHEARVRRSRHAPADDAPRVCSDDE